MLALVSLLTGCSGKTPPPAAPSGCGDRCGAMTCPGGTACTMDGNCNARCEPQPLRIP